MTLFDEKGVKQKLKIVFEVIFHKVISVKKEKAYLFYFYKSYTDKGTHLKHLDLETFKKRMVVYPLNSWLFNHYG